MDCVILPVCLVCFLFGDLDGGIISADDSHFVLGNCIPRCLFACFGVILPFKIGTDE